MINSGSGASIDLVARRLNRHRSTPSAVTAAGKQDEFSTLVGKPPATSGRPSEGQALAALPSASAPPPDLSRTYPGQVSSAAPHDVVQQPLAAYRKPVTAESKSIANRSDLTQRQVPTEAALNVPTMVPLVVPMPIVQTWRLPLPSPPVATRAANSDAHQEPAEPASTQSSVAGLGPSISLGTKHKSGIGTASTDHAAARPPSKVAARVGPWKLAVEDPNAPATTQQVGPTARQVAAGTFIEHERGDPGSGSKPAPDGGATKRTDTSLEDAAPAAIVLAGGEPAALPAPPVVHQVARALAGQVGASVLPAPLVAKLGQPDVPARELVIELNPAGLGRVVATLTRGSGQLRVRLSTDNEQVAGLLKSDIGILGTALAAAGVAASDITVGPVMVPSQADPSFSSHDGTSGASSHGQASQQRPDDHQAQARSESPVDSSSPGQAPAASGFYVI